jgi:hypothetical protein
MLEQQLATLADATVGQDSFQSVMKQNQLVGLHNQFMQLTSNRFTVEIKRGKMNGYFKTKSKVEQGIMVYNALLNRLAK